MFTVLSLYFLALGVLCVLNARTGFALFAVSLVALPTSLSLGSGLLRGGFYFFEPFFVFSPLAFLFHRIPRASLPSPRIILLYLGATIFLLASACISMMLRPGNIGPASLADLRIFLVLIEVATIYGLTALAGPISERHFIDFVLIASIFCIIYWVVNFAGGFGAGDVYYAELNRARYKHVGTEVAIVYALAYACLAPTRALFQSRRAKLALALAVTALLLSGSRAILAGLFIAALVASPSGRTRAYAGAGGLVGAMGLIWLRGNSAAGASGLLQNLTAIWDQALNRFSPAARYLSSESAFTLFFGHGFGSYFIIPWFTYRGLRAEQFVLDSVHVTMFVKYGVFYLLVLGGLLGVATAHLTTRARWAVVLYCFLIGTVVAFPYRPGFSGFVLSTCIIAAVCRGLTSPSGSAIEKQAAPPRSSSAGRWRFA